MYKIFSNEPLSASALIELCTITGFEESSKGVVPAKLSYILWQYATFYMENGDKDIHFDEFKKIFLKQAIQVAIIFKWNSPSVLVADYDPTQKQRSNFNLYALYWWTHSIVTNMIPIDYAIEEIATIIGSFTTVKDDESSSEVWLAWVVLTIFWFQCFNHLVTKLKYDKYLETLEKTEKILKTLKYSGKLALYTGLTISTNESANKDLSKEEFSVSGFFNVMWANAGGKIALFGMLAWLVGDTGDRGISLCKKLDKILRPGLHTDSNINLLGNQSTQQ